MLLRCLIIVAVVVVGIVAYEEGERYCDEDGEDGERC